MTPWPTAILHADLDAFFASVEQRDDPRLRGRPVIVGGGVVLAASYEARACGVRSAMGGTRARRLCPDAIVVPPRFDAYVEASGQVFTILERLTPRVERASIDEGYIDVGPAAASTPRVRELAAGLRRAVRDQAGLPISIGAAPVKVVAKIASGRAKPDGLLVVEPDGVLAFLHALEVDQIPGVGPATGERL
ncbi:MAG: polymerase, partial [Solirubrobacterales bacterium]|nr:polymerase [Solirubrobacterales bacterium]